MHYTLKRIGMFLVTMLLVSFLTFLAFELVSGDPVRTMLGTEARRNRLRRCSMSWGLTFRS